MKEKVNITVDGTVEGIRYSIDESIVEKLKKTHNIDAVKEIEEALKNLKEVERPKNAS